MSLQSSRLQESRSITLPMASSVSQKPMYRMKPYTLFEPLVPFSPLCRGRLGCPSPNISCFRLVLRQVQSLRVFPFRLRRFRQKRR